MEKKKRKNRTVHVDFQDESTYHRLIEDGPTFLEFVVAYVLSIGFQFFHKKHCSGHAHFQRHSHYGRIRLGGLCIWRIQCCECRATFSILPHFVQRYRSIPPSVGEKALIALNGGLSLENTSLILNISVMSIWRLFISMGRFHVAQILLNTGLSLPSYFQADEKHTKRLTEKAYLTTIADRQLVWHLGWSDHASAQAFEDSYRPFQQAALKQDPNYQVKGILTDGYESTRLALAALFPLALIGSCLLHAAKKISARIKGVSADIRQLLSRSFTRKLFDPPKLSGLEAFSVAQRLRHFYKEVRKYAGAENAQRVKEWIKEKKRGWINTIKDPNMPKTSTFLDQAHRRIDRKLFMMQAFHHRKGDKQAFLNTLALLYNFIPYQRRAKNSHSNGVQVHGGKMPHQNWFFSLMILTAAGGMIPSS